MISMRRFVRLLSSPIWSYFSCLPICLKWANLNEPRDNLQREMIREIIRARKRERKQEEKKEIWWKTLKSSYVCQNIPSRTRACTARTESINTEGDLRIPVDRKRPIGKPQLRLEGCVRRDAAELSNVSSCKNLAADERVGEKNVGDRSLVEANIRVWKRKGTNNHRVTFREEKKREGKKKRNKRGRKISHTREVQTLEEKKCP